MQAISTEATLVCPIPPRVESVPNHRFVAMLKGARKRLWDGRGVCSLGGQYICYSLPNLSGMENLCHLKEDIEDRLGESIAFDAWLEKQGVPNNVRHEDDEDGVLGTVSVQAARLRWIDQLIEEFGGTP